MGNVLSKNETYENGMLSHEPVCVMRMRQGCDLVCVSVGNIISKNETYENGVLSREPGVVQE